MTTRGMRSIKRGCDLTPNGDICPPSGVAEQLFYIICGAILRRHYLLDSLFSNSCSTSAVSY